MADQELKIELNRKEVVRNSPKATQPSAHWHVLAPVLVVTFLVYARTLGFEFVHDDVVQVLGNAAVHSWDYVPQYFTKHVWAFEHPQSLGNYYRPIFLLWCRLNEAVFGDQPGLWHLTTVLTHLIATALVYFLAFRLLRDQLTSGLAAAIFGLHPAHIEGVAWIAGVTEPLMAVFLIGSFLCFLHAREDKHRQTLWRSLALFLQVMAMLEKETGVVLPGVFFVFEWIFGQYSQNLTPIKSLVGRFRNSLWVSLPYFLLVPPYLAARYHALGALRYVIDNVPLKTLVFTWPSLLLFWIKHLLIPFGLASYYDQRRVDVPTLSNFVLPGILVLVVLGIVGYFAHRSKTSTFALAWIVIPLLPLLDIRSLPKNDFAHDRYLYLPSVGLAILLAMALRRISTVRRGVLGIPLTQLAASTAVLCIFAAGTMVQSSYFRNDWTFYRYNLSYSPHNVYMLNDYAVILSQYGMQDRALDVFQRAIHEDPEYWDSLYNAGYMEFKRGNYMSAEHFLLKATTVGPEQPDTFLNLGLVELRLGKVQPAETFIRKAIQINPKTPEYHYALGVALEIQGNLPAALKAYDQELAINPRQGRARRQAESVRKRIEASPGESISP